MEASAFKSRILVVDDDRLVCGFLGKFLGSEGYAVTAVHDGRGMRRALANDAIDLVILDLGFPGGEDGVSLARGLRSQHDLPLIVLSGKAATIDKVVCLELGADDYVTKPFEPRELLARIRTVLRRFRRSTDAETEGGEDVVHFAGWLFDATRYKLKAPDGRDVRLTSQEFHIFEALVRRRGRVLSREQILDIVANRDWTPYDRSIDVLVGKIRRKLDDDVRSTQFIKTVRGLGYMFAPPSDDEAGRAPRSR